jgi:hypothetical protein
VKFWFKPKNFIHYHLTLVDGSRILISSAESCLVRLIFALKNIKFVNLNQICLFSNNFWEKNHEIIFKLFKTCLFFGSYEFIIFWFKSLVHSISWMQKFNKITGQFCFMGVTYNRN